jgi:hypothetical protein
MEQQIRPKTIIRTYHNCLRMIPCEEKDCPCKSLAEVFD